MCATERMGRRWSLTDFCRAWSSMWTKWILQVTAVVLITPISCGVQQALPVNTYGIPRSITLQVMASSPCELNTGLGFRSYCIPIINSHLVSRRFEPSQTEKIISGLKTYSNRSPSYSFYKPWYHKSLFLKPQLKLYYPHDIHKLWTQIPPQPP